MVEGKELDRGKDNESLRGRVDVRGSKMRVLSACVHSMKRRLRSKNRFPLESFPFPCDSRPAYSQQNRSSASTGAHVGETEGRREMSTIKEKCLNVLIYHVRVVHI